MERILIVEDDPAVQRTLERLFELGGYCVDITGDGPSALTAFRSVPPLAVVLDLNLPLLSGKDVCRQMKLQRPEMPVVILSAITEMSERIALLEMGADDYVTKPFSPKELLSRVGSAIRRVSGSTGPRLD